MKIRSLLHWDENPLLPLLVFATVGKIVFDHFHLQTLLVLGLGVALLVLAIGIQMAIRRSKNPQKIAPFRSILSCGLFLFMGTTVASLQSKPENIASHSAYTARIQEEFGPTASGKIRCLALIEKIKTDQGWEPISEKGILFLDGNPGDFANGTQLVVSKQLTDIETPTIPGQFDAKQYFGRQGIRFQQFIPKGQFQFLSEKKPQWLRSKALWTREWMATTIRNSMPEEGDAHLMSALLLGVKRNIDPELKVAFSAAGISHILAVSGMHVGLIFIFLLWTFSWLKSIKGGHYLFSITIISCLWFYALITGFSPSVLRAVTVFSILQAGELLRKPSWPINGLCLATVILFCFDSNLVYDVGYQLSFTAVYGIVSFQRPIQQLFWTKNKVLAYFWNGTALTLAATLGTFPLILYYFHQFPVYFIFANLIAVPLANFIIYGGIGLLVLSPFPAIGQWLGWIIHWLIALFTGFIKLICTLPFSTIQSIFFPIWFLGFLFAGLIFFQLWLRLEKEKMLRFGLLCLCTFLFSFLGYNLYLWKRAPSTYVIRTKNEWMLAGIQGRQASLVRLGSEEVKGDKSFETKALKEGLHVLDVQSFSNPGIDFSFDAKDSSRKSSLVFQSGKSFLFLGNYLKIKNKLDTKIQIDHLVAVSQGSKSIQKALAFFEPKEIWVDWSDQKEKEWRQSGQFASIQVRNFKRNRFQRIQ